MGERAMLGWGELLLGTLNSVSRSWSKGSPRYERKGKEGRPYRCPYSIHTTIVGYYAITKSSTFQTGRLKEDFLFESLSKSSSTQ
jgi:hypothetical protein